MSVTLILEKIENAEILNNFRFKQSDECINFTMECFILAFCP